MSTSTSRSMRTDVWVLRSQTRMFLRMRASIIASGSQSGEAFGGGGGLRLFPPHLDARGHAIAEACVGLLLGLGLVGVVGELVLLVGEVLLRPLLRPGERVGGERLPILVS